MPRHKLPSQKWTLLNINNWDWEGGTVCERGVCEGKCWECEGMSGEIFWGLPWGRMSQGQLSGEAKFTLGIWGCKKCDMETDISTACSPHMWSWTVRDSSGDDWAAQTNADKLKNTKDMPNHHVLLFAGGHCCWTETGKIFASVVSTEQKSCHALHQNWLSSLDIL